MPSLAAVKQGGTAAARTLLRAKSDAGTLRLGSRPAGTIKYVYARDTGGGRLLTIITADPVVLLGSGCPMRSRQPATTWDWSSSSCRRREQARARWCRRRK